MSDNELPSDLQAMVDNLVIDGLKKELAGDQALRIIIQQQIANVRLGNIQAFNWLMRDGNWQLGAAFFRYIEDGGKVL